MGAETAREASGVENAEAAFRRAAPEGLGEVLKARLAEARARLAARIPAGPLSAPADPLRPEPYGHALGREHAGLLDALVAELFSAAAASEPALAERVAVAAVGSYGRGAVALRADLDLRVLTRDAEAARPLVDRLLYPLWDLGVSVGHQVVSQDELLEAARQDLPTATSLLDWRHLAGDRVLSEALRERALAGIFAHSELPRFLARLEAEIEARHERFGDSVYLLEPDVKNGAGGLRDLDVGTWAAKARFGTLRLRELVRVGALVPREAREIRGAGETLWRLRNLLHAKAGRRSDRLTFFAQEALAEQLGYGAGGEAVERMMSDYYRAARTISRALETMMSRAMPTLSRRRRHEENVGGGVRLFDGAATFTDAAALRQEPVVALRVLAAAVSRGAPLTPHARDVISSCAAEPAFCEELRASAEARRLFRELVATCRETRLRAGSAPRELHDLGLLLAMVPEFSPVVGRVHHDAYHVYTVDVHSVAAVDRLAALTRGELAAEFPTACRLAAELPGKETLFFATLLHDIGKVIGGKDHSQRGAAMAREILARLDFSTEDIDEACQLIDQHLVMYHVATRRDLDDDATIAEFCRVVRHHEGLRNLYLLTVADLSTTSPTSMTSWKARMLDELYLATEHALAKRGGEDGEGRLGRARREARSLAEAYSDARDPAREARLAFVDEFVRVMPARYLLSNASAAVVAHAEIALTHDAALPGEDGRRPVAVELVPSRHPEASELCVVADDRPGLLAAITAAIAASRLEVHAAQIHSRRSPAGVQAVDLFWVRDRGGGGPEAVSRALPKLRRDLEGILSGALGAEALVLARSRSGIGPRPSPRVGTQVSFDDRASGTHSVLEVLCRDRPGVLFTIADCLYRLGLTIALAKITTEGTRVADVFYVGEAGGGKLGPSRRQDVKAALLAALEALETEGTR